MPGPVRPGLVRSTMLVYCCISVVTPPRAIPEGRNNPSIHLELSKSAAGASLLFSPAGYQPPVIESSSELILVPGSMRLLLRLLRPSR